jgi:E3 ubiquitin-protein ligase RNF216
MVFIDSTLNDTRRHLYPAYMILEEAERTYDPTKSPYNKIKKPRATASHWTPIRVEETLNREGTTADTMLVLRELQAARRARKKADDKRQAERQAQLDEEENIRRAQAEGTMLECGCCFCDFPLNRMVHCENEQALHWFCRPCARQVAENEIGNSKYQIKCMSMDGCDFGFSRHTKNQFLDEKALIALDRNEQEEMLRLAGIENLESCPFCPFAAEYPSVEEDREFRCQAPDCEKISCRLCKLESHIPKSCAEYAKDKGLSVRRQIEEAMSAALIRKCNKCGTPFVKEEGCNKMTCTRSGCFNVQCYVCSKSCSYDHFNDRSRGGKPGNCPLFENVEERHHEEVSKAEKEALARVRAEHPEYTEEDLKVKVSENVKRDEERRRNSDPRNPIPGGIGHRVPAAGIFPHRVRG